MGTLQQIGALKFDENELFLYETAIYVDYFK